MKRILLASALALVTTTTFALAEITTLTDAQMDTIAAGKRAEVEGQGNLNNDNVQNNPGTVTVSGPPGQINNQQNFDCNNCVNSGPGNSNNN
jgi:hypothetical protein